MYCNHCGKEIPDNSKFCNFCGKVIELNNTSKESDSLDYESTNHTNTTEDTSSGCLKAIGIILLTIILCIIIPVSIVYCNTPEMLDALITSDITNADYEITTKEGLGTYTITITPNVDIKQCEVELWVYNDTNQKIYEDTLTKENLKAGTAYQFKFNFSLETLISGNKLKYDVSGTK